MAFGARTSVAAASFLQGIWRFGFAMNRHDGMMNSLASVEVTMV